MKELIVNNCVVRIFGKLVKIYAKTQLEADRIWDYLNKEGLIKDEI